MSAWIAAASAAEASLSAGFRRQRRRQRGRSDQGRGLRHQCAHACTSGETVANTASSMSAARSISAASIVRGRQQADDLLVGPVDQQPALARGIDDGHRVDVQLQAPHQARAPHLDDHRVLSASVRSRRSKCVPTAFTCSSRPCSINCSRKNAAARVPSRLPPYVLPWSPAEIVCATRSDTSAAPTGTPPPSALPTEIRSGRRPSACEIERITGSAEPGLHLVGDIERAGAPADVVDGRGELRAASGECRPRPESARR